MTTNKKCDVDLGPQGYFKFRILEDGSLAIRDGTINGCCPMEMPASVAARLRDFLSEEAPEPEQRCECGHLRSEHSMGTYYCMAGCYTNDAQVAYFAERPELEAQLKPYPGQRPTCARFTLKETA